MRKVRIADNGGIETESGKSIFCPLGGRSPVVCGPLCAWFQIEYLGNLAMCGDKPIGIFEEVAQESPAIIPRETSA